MGSVDASLGATHIARVTAANFVSGATDAVGTVTILPSSGTFPVGTVVQVIGFRTSTSFTSSDTHFDALALTIGDGDSASALLASASCLTAGQCAAGYLRKAYNAADTVEVFATVGVSSGTALASELLTGAVDIYLKVGNINDYKEQL